MKEQQLVRLSMIDQVRKVRIVAQLIENDNNPGLEKKIQEQKISLADAVLGGKATSELIESLQALEIDLLSWIHNHPTPDTIDVTEVSSKISEYVLDKMKAHGVNSVRDQIIPFVATIMSTSMVRVAGIELAHFLLVSDLVRNTMVFNMAVSFLTYKFLQNNNYRIITQESPISDEEIADLKRMNKENEIAAMAAIMGVSVEEYRQRLVEEFGGEKKNGGSNDTTH